MNRRPEEGEWLSTTNLDRVHVDKTDELGIRCHFEGWDPSDHSFFAPWETVEKWMHEEDE